MQRPPGCRRTLGSITSPSVFCIGPSSAARVLLVHCQCEDCARSPQEVITLDTFCAHASGAAPEAGMEEDGEAEGEEDDTAVNERCWSTLNVLKVGDHKVGVHARGLYPPVVAMQLAALLTFLFSGRRVCQPEIPGPGWGC